MIILGRHKLVLFADLYNNIQIQTNINIDKKVKNMYTRNQHID
jgi:hypothetical protein